MYTTKVLIYTIINDCWRRYQWDRNKTPYPIKLRLHTPKSINQSPASYQLQLSTTTQNCSVLFTPAPYYPQLLKLLTTAYNYSLSLTTTHHYTQLLTITHGYSPLLKTTHHYAKLLTTAYNCSSLPTTAPITHNYSPLPTTIHLSHIYSPLLTITHNCSPLLTTTHH